MAESIVEILETHNIKVLEKIGSGGFKSVYKAEVNGLVETLKVTQLVKPSISDPEDRSNCHMKMLARSRREFDILKKIGGENLVSLGSVEGIEFEASDAPYYVYSEEFLDGKTLRNLGDMNQNPTAEDVVELFVTGIKVLKKLEKNKTIHRDIKPQNIMELTDAERRFVFFDLGIAYQFDDESITSTGDIAPGTRLYRAPETLYPDYKDELDIRSDLYSLAVTVFVYATGCHPLVSDFHDNVVGQILNNPARKLSDFRSDVPLWLAKILGECLKKEPALRPSMLKIEGVLEGVL